jgi:hypothetical protein
MPGCGDLTPSSDILSSDSKPLKEHLEKGERWSKEKKTEKEQKQK